MAPKAEKRLRQIEHDDDSFEDFQKKCIKAVKGYVAPQNLVGSMAKRMKLVVEMKGDNIRK